MNTFALNVEPMGAPRMNRSDTWRKRPCVISYRAFRDQLRAEVAGYGSLPPDGWSLVFRIEMPESWSDKKKGAMFGTPHRQKPDIDNLWKAVTDTLFENDSSIWHMRATKVWAWVPSIDVVFDEGYKWLENTGGWSTVPVTDQWHLSSNQAAVSDLNALPKAARSAIRAARRAK